MTDYPNNIPTKLEIIKASEITPKEVRWLWYPYIPFGKVTLLQGDPGDGKSNLAPMGSAILFEVADKGVNFLDELELSAEDAFSATAPRMGRPNAREEAATDFIRSLLAGGRRLASDCEAKLEAAGFKKSTYKKSKKKAGVRSVKDGFLWYWTLPEVEKPIENGQEVTDEDDLPI